MSGAALMLASEWPEREPGIWREPRYAIEIHRDPDGAKVVYSNNKGFYERRFSSIHTARSWVDFCEFGSLHLWPETELADKAEARKVRGPELDALGHEFTPPNVSAGDLSDEASVRQYRASLDALEGEILEAENAGNTEQVLLLKEKADEIEKHLKSVTGLGGVPRRAADDNEQARKSVSNAIARARAAVKEHHFTLWQHLHRHITTGNFCAYQPPEGMVSWTVAFADRRPSGAHPAR